MLGGISGGQRNDLRGTRIVESLREEYAALKEAGGRVFVDSRGAHYKTVARKLVRFGRANPHSRQTTSFGNALRGDISKPFGGPRCSFSDVSNSVRSLDPHELQTSTLFVIGFMSFREMVYGACPLGD